MMPPLVTPSRAGVAAENPHGYWPRHTYHTYHPYRNNRKISSSIEVVARACHACVAGVGRNVWFGVPGVTRPVSMRVLGCHSIGLSGVAGVADLPIYWTAITTGVVNHD